MINGNTEKRLNDWGYEIKNEGDNLLEVRRIADNKLIMMMYYENESMYVVSNGQYFNPKMVKDLYPSEEGITVDAIYGEGNVKLPIGRLIKVDPIIAAA